MKYFLTRYLPVNIEQALPSIWAIMCMSLSFALPYCDTLAWHQIQGPCKISYSLVQSVWHSERLLMCKMGFMWMTTRVEHCLLEDDMVFVCSLGLIDFLHWSVDSSPIIYLENLKLGFLTFGPYADLCQVSVYRVAWERGEGTFPQAQAKNVGG